MLDPFDGPIAMTDADYALRRLTTRTYISKSFPLKFDTSRDFGQPARYINRVFDVEPLPEGDHEWEEFVVRDG
ncbi:MAG TPA: hypothetical protein VGJ95_22550 [Pseudonocardiaceae bacterium]